MTLDPVAAGDRDTLAMSSGQATPRTHAREGMVTIWDHEGTYLGCCGSERWQRLLADDSPERSADRDAEEAWESVHSVALMEKHAPETLKGYALLSIAAELWAARVRERVINVPSLYIRATADEKEEQ